MRSPARGLRRLRVESPGRGHEVAFVGFDEGSRAERLRRRERARPEDVDIGLGRSDLELAVRRRELAGHLEPRAAGKRPGPDAPRTTSPALASPIAISAGVPRRPGSATTTPVVRTRVPSGRVRTAFSGVMSAAGRRDRRRGVGVAVGRGVGVAVGAGTLVGVGVALGAVGVGSTDALGVGVGVGRGRRRRERELAIERRLDPVAARARPGAVSLPERAGHRRHHPGRDRLAAERHPAR